MKKHWKLGVLILFLAVVAGIGLWKSKEYFGKSLIREESTEEGLVKESEAPSEPLMATATQEFVLDPDDVMKWGREVYLPKQSAEPQPTQAPTEQPADNPMQEETAQQTVEPMQESTTQPTTKPTQAPTAQPTAKPTQAPTVQPTTKPTQAPEITQTSEDPCANGHIYDDGYVWAKSTCTVPGDYCWHCIICGHEKHLIMPLAEHQMEKTLLREGDCIWPDEYKYVCANCPHFYYEEDYSQMENRHHWVTGTYQVFDENLLEWVDVTRTYCSRCNKDKE